MLRILSILFFIAVLNTGYSQTENNQLDSKGQKQGFWQKRLPNGNLQYEGTFKNGHPVGVFKRYHTNGLIGAKLLYSENSDTIPAELYDMRGKLMAKGNYIGQKKDGTWQYFQNGQLVSEEYFVNGKKNGVSKTYYPTGEFFEETNWKNGKKSGKYTAHFKSGKPYMECQMTDGKRNGTCLVYFNNGRLEMDGFYREGLRVDEWKYYKENGDYSYSLFYDSGLLQNPAVLDSVQELQFESLDKDKNKLVDPEKFMDDPMQYMMKNNMLRNSPRQNH